MAKRKVPALNASSMADISFLLLVFFLVTTSMDVSQGLARRLPRMTPPQDKPENIDKVKDRDIFLVKLNDQPFSETEKDMNQLLVEGQVLSNKVYPTRKDLLRELHRRTKEFILNPNNDPDLPELFTEDIPGLGTITYTKKHIISIQNDVGTYYQAYLDVQNELVAVYNEVREEFAQRHFRKPYNLLTEDEQKLVQQVYPQKISEAEPKNYGGKK